MPSRSSRAAGARSFALIEVIVSAFLCVQLSHAAGAQSGPSPNELFQLQKKNRTHPLLRITSDSGIVERKEFRLDGFGLHGRQTTDGAHLAGAVPWSRIQRIDEVVTRASFWSKTGAVTLGLLGAGLGNALGAPDGDGGNVALLGSVAFGGLGGYVGGQYGKRFRRDRNWYVADTANGVAAVEPMAIETVAPAATPVSMPSSDPDVIKACNRIDRDKLFRAIGSFGLFEGYAELAGPDGFESLRAHYPRARGAAPPARISWDQVDQVEIRGGSALRGGVRGAAVFAAVGAMFGAAAAAGLGGDNATVGGGALVGAAVVAPVGFALGGLVGAGARRWVVVYQRR